MAESVAPVVPGDPVVLLTPAEPGEPGPEGHAWPVRPHCLNWSNSKSEFSGDVKKDVSSTV